MNAIRKTSAIVVCAFMIATALFVLPAASERSEAAVQAPLTLTIGVDQSPDNLNPFAGYLSISYQIYMLMYDMLVGVDKDLNPCPQLATSWNHSTDGKIWNYTLVRNAKWHDNTPLTAHDVAFTYNLILDNPGPCALYTDYVRNFTSVVALDNYTVQITTDTPKATMLSIIVPILPQHLWDSIPAAQLDKVDHFDTRIFPTGPVGSGPFILDGYAVDDFVRFRTFADYYGGTVHFTELIYKVFLDTEAMLNALQAGQVDVACYCPANAWNTILGWDNVDGQAVREITMTELGLNVCPVDLRYAGASTNYELLNNSVRKAMAMAINKTDLLENVYYNLADEGSAMIPPASAFWHYNVTPAEKYNFNITRANEILEAAGYIDSDGDDVRENSTSGVELSFLFNVILEEPEDIQAGTRIYNWLQQIGIYAPPQAISEDALITQWIGMKYDMYIWGWGGDADPSFLLSVMTTDQIPDTKNDWSAWSDCFYSNPYYDQMFIQQQNTIDKNARQAIVHEMQRVLYVDSPYMILAHEWGLHAYRTDRFTNWPDMVAHPGMGPFTGWLGGPWLFFEIVPYAGYPPTNVDAGGNRVAALNETQRFTGNAQDADDPIENLTWTWEFLEPNGTTNTVSGREVNYKFVNLGIVTVTLTVTDPGNLSGSATITVEVKEITNAGWLEGYVKDSAGDPIVAAIVQIGDNTRTTDTAGHYNFTLSAGSYNVSSDATGYTASGEYTVVVTMDNVTWQNFTLLLSSGTLTGHVYDSKTDLPLEGVLIVGRMGEVSAQKVTNSSGAYTIDLLEAGVYAINASKSGYETFQTSVTITAGNVTTLDIDLVQVEEGGGLSTAALAAIAGIIIAIVVVAAVFLLWKRKKGAAGGSEPPQAPPKT